MNKLLTRSLLCLAVATATNSLAAENIYPMVDANGATEPQYWVTFGQDAVADLYAIGGQTFLLPSHQTANAVASTPLVAIAQLKESQLSPFSRVMHEKHHRCGGYIVHDSLQSALVEQQRGPVSSQFAAGPLSQQATVNSLMPNLAKENIIDTINYLANTFVNRFYNTAGGVAASNGLRDRWQSMAAGKSYVNVSQFSHSWAQKSVVMTITGSELASEFVVLGGHLDSTVGRNTGENSSAPGADDDASGVATITEIARVLLTNGQPKRSVKFIAYAAEEVGLLGSKAIAENHKANGINVIGALQLDMTNYKGSTEDIVFMSDYTSSAQNTFMTQLLDEYAPAVKYGFDSCGYACSDHASWYNNGYPASMPFEARFNGANPRIHTGGDTLANMDTSGEHALNFAKLGLAYVIEMANAGEIVKPTDEVLENGVAKVALNAQTGQSLGFTFEVPANATNLLIETQGGSGDADLYVKLGAVPSDNSYDCRPYKNGNAESCSFASGAGTYYVALKAYSDFANLTLTASYQGASTGNQKPQVSVTHPTGGSQYKTGDSVTFSATASDSDGQISQVDFVLDGRLLTTDSIAPYSYNWQAGSDGSHSLVVTATDDKGATASQTVSFKVGGTTNGCIAVPWNATTIYNSGDRASKNGHVYEAQWWTQGDDPTASTDPWYVWTIPASCQ